jgi:cytochrome c biogenesis protein CcdA
MKRSLFLFFGLFFLRSFADDYVCATYFTQEGCQGCAQTDPAVLHTWLQEMPHLVVVEYVINGDGSKDNQHVFLEYSKKLNFLSLVPQISYDNKNAIGPAEILPLKNIFKKLDETECTLLDEEFDEMDLNKLSGKPRIWWRDRVLLKTGEGTINSDELRGLFLNRDVDTILQEKRIETWTIPLSGNDVMFAHAYKISDGWILQTGAKLLKEPSINKEEGPRVRVPFVGEINHQHSLFVLTVLLGLADGFNPCAFFILTFLLAAMLYAASESLNNSEKRKRILFVGFTFVFFSAAIYFLFMGLWFNAFKFISGAGWLSVVAGLIALFAGVINIKDYFFFQRGISFTLPKSQKEKFVEKVGALKNKRSVFALLAGTILIAVTVNLYELLCTFGIPMVYLRLLTMHTLTSVSYYCYLLLYNVAYVLPLVVIVIIFGITLGAREFSKRNVQRLKLVSGFMVLFLGVVLIFKPILLKSGLLSLGIIGGAILLSIIVMSVYEHFFIKN